MLPIQEWELTGVRVDIEAVLLTGTGQHRRPTQVETDSGGRRTVMVSLGTVSLRLEPTGENPKDLVAGEGRRTESWWDITLPADTKVQTTDQFIVNNNAYEVVDGDGFATDPFAVYVRARHLKGLIASILLPEAVSAGWAVQSATLLRGIFFYPGAVSAEASVRPATLVVG